MPLSLVVLMERCLKAFSDSNALSLREVANDAISQASLENDSAKAELAVVAYALSKLLSKEHFGSDPAWVRVRSVVEKSLVELVVAAKKQDSSKLAQELGSIVNQVSQVDANLGYFWQNVIEKGRVKQASTAYALGLSLSQAASLTRCDKNELFSYIGFTKLHEDTPEKGIFDRVKSLKSLLGKSG